MNTLSRGRVLAGGVVFMLVAFGVFGAAFSALQPSAQQPLMVRNSAQIIEVGSTNTTITVADR